MKRVVLTLILVLLIIGLIISNISNRIKIAKIEDEIKKLKEPDSFFSSRRDLINFVESRVSSLWEFISLQQKQIEFNENRLEKINHSDSNGSMNNE